MSQVDMIDDLGAQVDALEDSLGGAVGMAAQFDAELKRIHETFSATGRGAQRLEAQLSRGVSRAIDGVVLDGMKLSDALQTVAQSMIDSAWKAAVQPVAGHVGGMLAGGLSSVFGEFSPFAKGGSFTQGRVMPFANGGVVSGPTSFPMRGGTGLMGEAGPEAIMPLTRGADGKLGVRASGGGQPVTVVMNIQTPDVQGFQRSQSQIAARMSQALGRGARNR
ncbi:phage tail tape measure protein [Tropicibacter naphthalenivorans]|uniref:Phage tail tape measure protein, lambda family n=1 Tax=Tropicibacter naphthalenivorans TaxID=441103 RepID=A0A0P1GFA7_9RHOB|nr:phage tail tape measure protein [Tropicibacter naphthalenivorans]CUH80195.1 phage tail tape measure protein, lambda family [Tropicibacter naphthalenivorans]SMC85492.1 phage tail tape measure protein, lambda family [Tropicibacter naphthalenivorans]